MVWRSRPREIVIQICWIAPSPAISASVKVPPGSMTTYGDIFQPGPRSRAWRAAGPSTAIPPLPFSPVKFSGLIERDSAFDRRDKLPRWRPSPENVIVCPIVMEA